MLILISGQPLPNFWMCLIYFGVSDHGFSASVHLVRLQLKHEEGHLQSTIIFDRIRKKNFKHSSNLQ